MASRYAAEGSHNTAADTVLSMVGSATIRGALYYVSLGSESSPADKTIVASLKTMTLDGTGTAVTPVALDAADRAPLCTAKQAYSSEPTYAGIGLLNITINQRSHYQFYAQEGGEFLSNPVAGDGFGLVLVTLDSATPTMSSVFHWKE